MWEAGLRVRWMGQRTVSFYHKSFYTDRFDALKWCIYT